jgi:hypothetical protein
MLANLTPQRAEGTQLAPRWRLRPGRRAPMRFSRAFVLAVSGPILAGFGRFWRPARRTSTPGGAWRGPWAAALPRRGSPGPAGVRWCDLRAAAGPVGRQGGVCPRLAAGGPHGEVPTHSTPRHLVEATRSARAAPAGRSDPLACSWDSVGPAQASQNRPEGAWAFLWGVCPRALTCPILACCGAFSASRRALAVVVAASPIY